VFTKLEKLIDLKNIFNKNQFEDNSTNKIEIIIYLIFKLISYLIIILNVKLAKMNPGNGGIYYIRYRSWSFK
jgi:hypothetical protein